jgi:hypothetical protein
MKRLLAVLILFGSAGLVQAQLRTIPQDAQRGAIRHVQEMIVDIDGTQRRLAPAAQIRDTANRIVVPTAIPPGTLAKYRLDKDGFVLQVWFLTPEEAKAN